MPTTTAVSLTPQVLIQFLRRHIWLWALPAAAGLVLAAIASLVVSGNWEATQGFIIRSEAAGVADQRLGKFSDLSEMKAVQETVLEVARSQSVLAAALKQVGPPRSMSGRTDFPSPREVVDLRENMRITPPGGAEFGLTEVFYLSVFHGSPQRAGQLAAAVADQLERRMSEVRDERAVSMIRELEQSVAAARSARDVESNNLATFESKVGADLAELRALESPIGGQGELAQTAIAIEAALRDNAADQRRNAQLAAMLRASLAAPENLLATPSTLLASQPALDRLKIGLVNARMNAASLSGTRSDRHPMVVAARNREAQLRSELRRELPVALAGVELARQLNAQRASELSTELEAARSRLAALAGKRSHYSNLVASVENHTELVEAAEDQLADARAHRAGASSSSVLSRIDEVETGLTPVGPGRTATTLAGGVAGLVLGLGLLFSLHSPVGGLASEHVPSYAETAAGPFGSPSCPPAAGWATREYQPATVHAGAAGRNESWAW
ncbi:MAG: hypothetical protein AAF596_00390 [Planctomycetota bacterium]